MNDIMYQVQSPPDARWSEWRPVTEPVKEPLILSLRYNKVVTWEESNAIMERILK